MSPPIGLGPADRTLEPDELVRAGAAGVVGAAGALRERDGVVVVRTRLDGERVVQKRASGAARATLRREAELLDRLVLAERIELIEVVETDDDLDDRGDDATASATSCTVMVTRDAGTATLADTSGLRDDEVLRALRRTVDAVRSLHAAGWVHGALTADHVVVGARGRVRLCSFGAAHPVDVDDPTATAGDVRAAVDLVEAVGRRSSSERSWRARSRWRRTARRLRSVAATARSSHDPPSTTSTDLAAALAEVQRGAGGRPRPAVLPVTAAVLAILLVMVWRWPTVTSRPAEPAGTRSTPSTASATSSSTPTSVTAAVPDCAADGTADVDGDGCPDPVSIDGHVVSVDGRTYRLGEPGDLAAVGDWDCDGIATARLVRSSTGEVFEFSGWATAEGPMDGPLIGVLSSAAPVDHVRTAPGDGTTTGSCDRLVVAPQDGEPPELEFEEAEP